MLGYFSLLLLFLLLFLLNFYFAFREWRRPRDDDPLPVDVEYIRVENYFGISFRAKMKEWLQTARPIPHSDPGSGAGESPVRAMLEKPNGERILLLAGGRFGGREERDELVYSEGDLYLSGGSVFSREIYCLGNLQTGGHARLQAVAADGEIVLGVANEVARWVDAQKKILLSRGTVVHSRVCSAEAIELETEVSAQLLYAPVVFTTGYRPMPDSALDGKRDDSSSAGQAPPSASEETPPYLDPARCSRMAANTWLVRGDLELPAGSRVESSLVVKGYLHTGPGCRFTEAVKAARVTLGPRNRVRRSLTSGTGIKIGEAGFVGEILSAENDIRLCAGVRVGTPGARAVVSAGGEVRMERNVAVCGKVAAGRAVIAV